MEIENPGYSEAILQHSVKRGEAGGADWPDHGAALGKLVPVALQGPSIVAAYRNEDRIFARVPGACAWHVVGHDMKAVGRTVVSMVMDSSLVRVDADVMRDPN